MRTSLTKVISASRSTVLRQQSGNQTVYCDLGGAQTGRFVNLIILHGRYMRVTTKSYSGRPYISESGQRGEMCLALCRLGWREAWGSQIGMHSSLVHESRTSNGPQIRRALEAPNSRPKCKVREAQYGRVAYMTEFRITREAWGARGQPDAFTYVGDLAYDLPMYLADDHLSTGPNQVPVVPTEICEQEKVRLRA